MNKDLNDVVEDEEKAKELSKIIEKKVEDKVKSIIENKSINSAETSQKKEISRRSFLKKLGIGAIGVGAASLIPSGAAYDIRSTDALEVYDDTGTKYFDVQPGGPVEVNNASLHVKNGMMLDAVGNNIEFQHNNDSGNLRDTYKITKNSNRTWSLVQNYDTEQLMWRDNSNNSILRLNQAGPVEILANLDVGGNKIKTSNFEVVENSSTNSLDFNYSG